MNLSSVYDSTEFQILLMNLMHFSGWKLFAANWVRWCHQPGEISLPFHSHTLRWLSIGLEIDLGKNDDALTILCEEFYRLRALLWNSWISRNSNLLYVEDFDEVLPQRYRLQKFSIMKTLVDSSDYSPLDDHGNLPLRRAAYRFVCQWQIAIDKLSTVLQTVQTLNPNIWS